MCEFARAKALFLLDYVRVVAERWEIGRETGVKGLSVDG